MTLTNIQTVTNTFNEAIQGRFGEALNRFKKASLGKILKQNKQAIDLPLIIQNDDTWQSLSSAAWDLNLEFTGGAYSGGEGCVGSLSNTMRDKEQLIKKMENAGVIEFKSFKPNGYSIN